MFRIVFQRHSLVDFEDRLVQDVWLAYGKVKDFRSRLVACMDVRKLRLGQPRSIPMIKQSLKPLVATKAHFSPFLSNSAFVATVVPIRIDSTGT
jgi:hypothetical protein